MRGLPEEVYRDIRHKVTTSGIGNFDLEMWARLSG
jgi:hypothetical protein